MPPTPTHCPYCALQCGMVVDTGTVTPREDVPANEGGALCQKGWTAAELLCASDRVTVPLFEASTGDRCVPYEPVAPLVAHAAGPPMPPGTFAAADVRY